MKQLNVLIACEESQRVCTEFRRLGHNAFSCDIQDCSGGHPEWHIKQDVTPLLEDDWDLIIAFPPCTYLTKASARLMYPKAGYIDWNRLNAAFKARDFLLQFLECKCKYVAVENPTPLKCVGLPKASQVIQPYQFGEPYSKRTLLWLKNLPPLKPTNILTEYKPFIPSNTSKFSQGLGNGSFGDAHSKIERSKTFKGIAQAMAEQWSEYLCIMFRL